MPSSARDQQSIGSPRAGSRAAAAGQILSVLTDGMDRESRMTLVADANWPDTELIQSLQRQFSPARVLRASGQRSLVSITEDQLSRGRRPILLVSDVITSGLGSILAMPGGVIVYVSSLSRPTGSGGSAEWAVSVLARVPGLTIALPVDPHDIDTSLRAAFNNESPTVIFEGRVMLSSNEAGPPIQAGPGFTRIWRRGHDVTFVAIAEAVAPCLGAADLLNRIGISAEIINPVTILPLDVNVIIDSAELTGRLLIIELGLAPCGIGAEIIAQVAERPVQLRTVRVQRLVPERGAGRNGGDDSTGLPEAIAAQAYRLVRPGEPPLDKTELKGFSTKG